MPPSSNARAAKKKEEENIATLLLPLPLLLLPHNVASSAARAPVRLTHSRCTNAHRWNVRLQRARKNLHSIRSQGEVDLSEFDHGTVEKLASESRFRRQQAAQDTTQTPSRPAMLRQSTSAASLDDPVSPRTPGTPGRPVPVPRSFKRQQTASFSSRLSRQELQEMFDEEGEEAEDEGAESPPKTPLQESPKLIDTPKVTPQPPPRPPAAPVPAASGLVKSAEMGEESTPPPLPVTICGTFSCHGMDEGKDKANQDCACLSYPLKGDSEAALFIVLDGHGDLGHVASNELLVQVFERMNSYVWDGDETTNTALCVTAFEEAHQHMMTYQIDAATGKGPGHESGAVGVAIVLRRGVMTMAWAGDCRAIMGTRQEAGAGGPIVCAELTKDHKLEDGATEQKRIEATGAFIRPTREEPEFSPARVFADYSNPRAGPGLTMSRSLGDIDADACGVIPTPEVAFRTIEPGKDAFLVLASDGLWEFISNDDVVNIVSTFLEQGKEAIDAARFLIAKAAMAWRVEEGDYRDDITCIVLYLHDLPGSLMGNGAAAAG